MAVARHRRVEIISADSRQVYRGMDVGTAKPTRAERDAVRHHLIDVVAPDEPFSVAQWVERARRAVAEAAAGGALPLVVGGTGLYISALVDGFDFGRQPWSPELRRQLSAELHEHGLEAAFARLSSLAPAVAARVDARNPRRVLRALERAEQGSGDPPAATPYPGPVVLIGLDVTRDELDRRIEERARRMFAGGLLDEARMLLEHGRRADLPALSGHGYAEAIAVVRGTSDVDEAVASTARRTRQYARRQLTWFRRDARVVWLRPGPDLLERALALLPPGP